MRRFGNRRSGQGKTKIDLPLKLDPLPVHPARIGGVPRLEAEIAGVNLAFADGKRNVAATKKAARAAFDRSGELRALLPKSEHHGACAKNHRQQPALRLSLFERSPESRDSGAGGHFTFPDLHLRTKLGAVGFNREPGRPKSGRGCLDGDVSGRLRGLNDRQRQAAERLSRAALVRFVASRITVPDTDQFSRSRDPEGHFVIGGRNNRAALILNFYRQHANVFAV